jgi:flagellar basal-body rod modification protein FlgD
MQVDPTNSATSSTSTSATGQAAPAAPTLNYNAFLQLLIAEMKNQDPTKPMDSAQYVAQLATFSNVEQSVQANAKLDSLMTSFALSQADGLVGRNIVSADGTVGGQVVAVRVVTGGAVAILQNGQELPLGAGVTIA